MACRVTMAYCGIVARTIPVRSPALRDTQRDTTQDRNSAAPRPTSMLGVRSASSGHRPCAISAGSVEVPTENTRSPSAMHQNGRACFE